MFKIILVVFVLAAVAATTTALSSSAPSDDASNTVGGEGSGPNPSLAEARARAIKYYPSSNNAYYAAALADCRTFGDELVEIDNNAELIEFADWLQSNTDSFQSAWVGGKLLQPANIHYGWESNSVRIPENFWATGEPSMTRADFHVYVDVHNRAQPTLKVQPGNTAARYICEIP